MDRQEHLATSYKRIEALTTEGLFLNNLSQVRARAIQEELLSGAVEIGFTFDAKQVWKYCDYIFSEGALLLREGTGDRQILFNWIRTAAQTFEFLSKFADETDKEILLLNSAMCYHIAGYQANARCLTNLVEKNHLPDQIGKSEDNNPDAILTGFFRHALVNFLKRDVAKLQTTTAQAVPAISNLQEMITKGIAEQNLSVTEMFNVTAHAYFQKSLADFVQFCLHGDPETFAATYKSLQKSYEYFQKIGEVTLGTITSELRTVLDLFNERSTWSNISKYAHELLDDRVWQVYLRNMAFEKSIVEFWSSQLKAIESGLLLSNDSFIVQMPTSAGKTLIAELSILAALSRGEEAKCLYIAPYRALVNEIESSLTETLGTIGYRVSNLIGGFEFDTFQEFLVKEANVLVATPEKIELLLRTHPDYFESLSVIVVDEGHIVDEGVPSPQELGEGKTLLEELNQRGTLGRGPLLELLITRLKHRLPEARFIFLSAVMPEINAYDFSQWLSRQNREPLRINPEARPSRQVIAKFEWKGQNGEIGYVKGLPVLPDGKFPFVPFFIQKQQYQTGEYTPTGRPRKPKIWPNPKNKAQTTGMLAAKFAKTGPVLVFCAQPQHAKWVIDNIVTSLKYLEASNLLPNDKLKYVANPNLESFHLALDWLGEDHPLTKALHYGVALHYGPLPDPVRRAIETEFREDKIRILVSTNTLGQGVNLPVKTAIIYSLERVEGGENQGPQNQPPPREKVKKRDFWNICGRAGRAGKETEGQVVFVVASDRDKRLLAEFINEANLEEVNSALYKLLQALVQRRIDQDSLIEYLDSHVLAILAEEVIDTQDENAIKEWLGTSLVGIQAFRKGIDLTPLVSVIQRASAWIVASVPDQAVRQVFSSTGLRVASCEHLEMMANTFLQNNLDEEALKASVDKRLCSETFLRTVFTACQDLPEMRLREGVVYRGSTDEFEIINNWTAGKSISEIRLSSWDAGQIESFSEYIADRVIYKLPWGFNGFLRILAFKLKVEYEDLPMVWQHLPSMAKFGVNDVVACWAGSLGVSSRKMALQVAARYQPENDLSFSNFIKWAVNLPTDLILQELEGFEFEKRQLLNNLNRIVYDREHLDFIRNQDKTIISAVRGIPYEDRKEAASLVQVGDQLQLELNLDNLYDPYAVQVFFKDKQIGFVQRDKAKIISREMQLGREIQAQALEVKSATDSYPFPLITMNIIFG